MKRLKETLKDRLGLSDVKTLKPLKNHLKNASGKDKTLTAEQPVVQPIEQPTDINQ